MSPAAHNARPPALRPLALLLLRGLCAWACALAGSAGAANGANATTGMDGELRQLMALFAQRQHARARFQQSQFLAALTRPLQSTGTLSYDAPDHLEERIETPRRQQLVLDHGQLTAQLGRHRRTVRLSDYPQIAPLLDSIRALLAGDLPALQQNFTLQLSGPVTQWALLLIPRDPAVSASLRDIRMQGAGMQILQVRIEQSDGDHAEMHIESLP